MLEGKELREFAEGSTLCRGVARDVHRGRLNVFQYKGVRVANEICIAQLHLLCQSVEQFVHLEVVFQEGGQCGEVPHREALREHGPILPIDSKPQLEAIVFREEVS